MNRLLLSILCCCALLLACNTNKTTTSKTSISYDTARVKTAVNDYLRTHEKYYKLIDSIRYVIEPLTRRQLLLEEEGIYVDTANKQDHPTKTGFILPPDSTAHLPQRRHNSYHDSEAYYYKRVAASEDTAQIGYRVFVYYRLSDVMLTNSDFTTYLFYFDTAYHRQNKSDLLH